MRSLLRSPALAAVLTLLCLALPRPADGQSMRDTFGRLFVFGSGDAQLFLGGSAGVPTTEVHGDHFIPASQEVNGSMLGFLESTIATNVATFPLSSTVASRTFELVDGVPTPSTESYGPIFAERAETIGRGRVNLGINYSRLRFAELRGVDLEDVRVSFVHENSDFPGCDQIFGGDCSLYGIPQFENDVIDLTLDLDMEAEVFAFFATVGLADRLDLSVALPVVDFDFRGTSTATVVPTTGDEALHFFGGTPGDPVLTDRSQVTERAAGIGDLAVRLKAHVYDGDPWDLALLAEGRAPTGRAEDFLGTGEWNARGMAILSGRFSGFSPHLNVGYEYRGEELDPPELELAAGFDHRLAERVTLAVDFLAALELEDPGLALPETVEMEAPFRRTVRLTNVPNRRDDVIDGALGLKFGTEAGLVVVANVLVPLNDGGLRAGPVPTLGLEYSM